MSNTVRRDRNGKTYKESLKKHSGRFKCRCEYCLGKRDTLDKIAEKELKIEINSDDEIIWDKQAEFGRKSILEINELKDKYNSQNFEYKEEDYWIKQINNLQKYYNSVEHGCPVMEKYEYGEYVKIEDVLNLFSAKKLNKP